ncbi:MAG TPA: glycine--tRNA ligase [Candidatus Colwellbacteria bacterium]|nr:glycine--tRNA ligase [Candidatus Colwellbacteria bacterium]
MEIDLMDKILSLAKRRGFVFPGSEIYGGLQNSWDFGPLGVELKRNIKAAWWDRFIRRRPDMVGLDASILMNTKVWEASGHLKKFSDPLVECVKCHKRFRGDRIKTEDGCPECGGKLGEAKQFNMMLKTRLGATEDKASEVYFRPETAQGIFVNFKNIMDTERMSLPFGVGQIGKAFRNEITPGNFIFRTREFEQMEIEYFIPVPEKDKDWNNYFEYWRKEMLEWISSLGVDVKKEIRELEVPEKDRAHYSKRTVDFEYAFPFGEEELYGLAYRGDFDLKNHGETSGADLKYKDPVSGEEFYPHVIEPTFGVERSILAAMCSAYTEESAPTAEKGEEETRVVMKFPKWLAPVKAAVLPLSKKEELSSVAKKLADDLRNDLFVDYDETQSIGKRYRRQDEIGTPYCVTIDFDSLEDKKATIRDRDTMKQERVAIAEIKSYLLERFKEQ